MKPTDSHCSNSKNQ
ncbi:hypothetical protein LINPERPRIM_LOCUS24048 [Linum perenne]